MTSIERPSATVLGKGQNRKRCECSDRNCLNEGVSGRGLIEIFFALPLEVEDKLEPQDHGGLA
jgi:hypothetical protein